jgi:hypothetical protein
MSASSPPGGPPQGGGDPWAAFGYLVAGVAVYGVLGWGLATWLHAPFLIPIGIIVGAMLGILMVVFTTGVFSGSPRGISGNIPDKPEQPTHDTDRVPPPTPPEQGSAQHPLRGSPPGQSTDDRGDST